MREADAPSYLEDRAEQRRHRLALRDRVRGHERPAPSGSAEVVDRLFVPAGDVVQATDVLSLPHVTQLLRLLRTARGIAQERRVPEIIHVRRGHEQERTA